MIRIAATSLAGGGLIYAANRPGLLVAAKWLPLRFMAVDIPLLRTPWIRNHGADALFALTVGALLAWWSTRNGVSWRVAAAIGVVFLVVLECLGTTFDPIDIVVELAVFALSLALLTRRVRPLGMRGLFFRRAPRRL